MTSVTASTVNTSAKQGDPSSTSPSYAHWVDLRWIRDLEGILPPELFDRFKALESIEGEDALYSELTTLGTEILRLAERDPHLSETLRALSPIGVTDKETFLGARIIEPNRAEGGVATFIQKIFSPVVFPFSPYGDDFRMREGVFNQIKEEGCFNRLLTHPLTEKERIERRDLIKALTRIPSLNSLCSKLLSGAIEVEIKARGTNSPNGSTLPWYKEQPARHASETRSQKNFDWRAIGKFPFGEGQYRTREDIEVAAPPKSQVLIPTIHFLANPSLTVGGAFLDSFGLSTGDLSINFSEMFLAAKDLQKQLSTKDTPPGLKKLAALLDEWIPGGSVEKKISAILPASRTLTIHPYNDNGTRQAIASEISHELKSLYAFSNQLLPLIAWANFVNESGKRRLHTCWPTEATDRLSFSGLYNSHFALRSGLNIISNSRVTHGDLSLVTSGAQVIANDITLTRESPVICFAGGNGGGKTTLLNAIVSEVIANARGLPSASNSAEIPPTHVVRLSLDRSINNQTSSAFQSEMRDTADLMSDLLARSSHDGISVVALDELGRGTDKRDAIPLLLATVGYLVKRDVRVILSTHFLEVGKDRLLQELGVNAQYYSLTPGKFKIKKGWSKSGAIDVAAARGLPKAIVDAAIKISKGGAVARKDLTLPPKESVKYETFSSRTLADLRILKTPEYGGQLLLQGWTQELFNQAPWAPGYWNSQNAVNTRCTRFLTTTLTPEETRDRQLSIELLKGNAELEEIESILKRLQKFDTFFGLACSELDFLLDKLAPTIGTSGTLEMAERERRIKDAIRDFFISFPTKEKRAEFIRDLGLHIRNSPSWSNYTTTLNNVARPLLQFLASGGLEDLEENLLAKDNLQDTDIRAFFSHMHTKHRSLLQDIHERLHELNAFIGISKFIISNPTWKAVKFSETPLTVKAEKVINPELSASGIRVTPVDLDFSGNTPSLISGTNGGGKSKCLETLAIGVIFPGLQIGYAPAERALVSFSPLRSAMSTTRHTSDRSTFQGEIDRQSDTLEDVAGLNNIPAWVLIDEPNKGTATEEGAPLVAALAGALEASGHKLICSTHLYETFELIRSSLPHITADPRYVELFGEHRYQLLRGIGQSSGIRVAEQMGMPTEIIEMAKILQRSLNLEN